jgi:predicted  nucleic acid-binding Zn-ribbon protein
MVQSTVHQVRTTVVTVWILALTCVAASASVYMRSAPNELVYIRLDWVGSNILGANRTGQFTSVRADDRMQDGTDVTSQSFTGTVSGKEVSLSIGSLSCYGNLARGTLTLRIPRDSGQIDKLILIEVSEERWNVALAKFKARRLAEVTKLRQQQALERRSRELIEWIEQAFSDLPKAAEEIKHLKQTIGDYEKRLTAEQKKQAELDSHLRRSRDSLSRGQNQISEARSISDASGILAEQCRSASDLEAVRDTEQAVKNVSSRIEECAIHIADVASRVREVSGDTEQPLTAVDAQFVECKKTLESTSRRLRDLPKKELSDDERADIEKAAGEVEAAVGKVEVAIGDIETSIGKVETAIGSIESDKGEIEAQISELRGDIGTATDSLHRNQERMAQDERLLEHATKELQTLLPGSGQAVRALTLLRPYGAAIQYFNDGLSENATTRIARSVIGWSNRYGLDARLLLATLEAEGKLRKVSEIGTELRVGGRPANTEIAAVARDLRSRLAPTTKRVVTEQALVKALTGRYEAINGKGSRQADDYARKVMKLYRQLCGRDADERVIIRERTRP